MKKMISILIALIVLTVQCSAEDTFGISNAVNAVPDEVRAITGDIRDGSYDTQGALGRLWKSFIAELSESIRSRLSGVVGIVSVILIASIASTLCDGDKAQQCVDILCVCTVAVMTAGDINGLISRATDAVQTLVAYIQIAMPVLFTAAACSAPVTAASGYAAACFGIDILIELTSRLILPLINVYIALVCVCSVFTNTLISGIGKLVKTVTVFIMSGACIIFAAYMSITGIVSGSVDAAAVKAVKTGISTLLPVIGGIVSDASAAVLAAAGTVRASTGALGLVCVCAVCIAPFVSLGVSVLVFKSCAAIAQSFPSARTAKLLEGLSTAMSLQLGLLGSFCVMIFISIMAGIKAAGL